MPERKKEQKERERRTIGNKAIIEETNRSQTALLLQTAIMMEEKRKDKTWRLGTTNA